jgi:molybdopterin/thiamine biosynthesis adenylyltransferase
MIWLAINNNSLHKRIMEAKDWLCRNIGVISRSKQKKISSSRVLVAGLGGVGGICAELIVRAGVKKIAVLDSDKFEISNLNRQIIATRKSIGKAKVDVFADRASSIASCLELNLWQFRLDEETAPYFEKLLEKFRPNIAVDAMDDLPARVILARICKRRKIPYIYCAASHSRGMVGVFEGNTDMEKVLRLPSRGKPVDKLHSSLVHYPQCRSAWGPATNLAGVLGASCALNKILGKKYPRAPKFAMIDSFDEKMVHEERL